MIYKLNGDEDAYLDGHDEGKRLFILSLRIKNNNKEILYINDNIRSS